MTERTPPTAGEIARRCRDEFAESSQSTIGDAAAYRRAQDTLLRELHRAGLLPPDTPRAACKLCNDTGWEHHAVNDGQMIGSTMTRCRNGCASATTQNGGGLAVAELTFAQVSETNGRRCRRWHPGFPDDEAWSGADWSNAVCGEAGEMANVVKKLRRYECGLRGQLDPPEDELREMLADECADVYLYLDLLAQRYRVDLVAAIVRKFNAVSERQDFPERLAVGEEASTDALKAENERLRERLRIIGEAGSFMAGDDDGGM